MKKDNKLLNKLLLDLLQNCEMKKTWDKIELILLNYLFMHNSLHIIKYIFKCYLKITKYIETLFDQTDKFLLYWMSV